MTRAERSAHPVYIIYSIRVRLLPFYYSSLPLRVDSHVGKLRAQHKIYPSRTSPKLKLSRACTYATICMLYGVREILTLSKTFFSQLVISYNSISTRNPRKPSCIRVYKPLYNIFVYI